MQDTPTSTSSGSVFIGRGRELETLEAAAARACAGEGSCCLLCGEAGIGKTRLAARLAAGSSASMRVVWSAAREDAGAPAYWPWIRILESCVDGRSADELRAVTGEGCDYLVDMLPATRPDPARDAIRPRVESADVRFLLFDAAMRLLRAHAASRPLLIVLDDVHAADPASLMLLQFVAAEVRSSSILIVATHRDAPVADDRRAAILAELSRRTHRVPLGGFAAPEVAEYLERAFDVRPAPELVRAVHQKTEGNPFFVDEIARALHAKGQLASAPDRRAALPIPDNLRALVRQRLEPLGERARRVLDAAAVVGREFDVVLLEAASGLARSRVLETVASARSAGVLRADAGALGRYAFAHALIRDTLYDDVSEPRRVELHRRVAQALEHLHQAALDPWLGEIAYHHARAAVDGDASAAVEYARRAGLRASALLAFEVAAENFETGLAAEALGSERSERVRCELLLLAGEAAMRAGDVAHGRARCEEAAGAAHRLAMAETEARAVLVMGGPWVEIGSVDAGLVDALRRALDSLPDTDSVLRSLVLARLARELYWADDSRRASDCAQSSLAMARRLDDASALAAALTARAYSLWRPESLAERLAVDGEIITAAEDADDREMALRGRLWRLADLLELGDAAGLDAAIATYERLAGDARQPSYYWYVPRNRAMRALLRGEFDEAEALAMEACTIGTRAHPGLAAQALAAQAVVLRWERGQVEGQAAQLETFRRRYPAVAAWHCGQALLYAEEGDFARARNVLAEIDVASLRRDANWLLSLALLSLTCSRLGDTGRCADLLARMLPYRGRCVTMGRALIAFGTTSHFLGVLAAACGRIDEAETLFGEALAMHRDLGARAWTARSLAELATLAGRRVDANQLEEARRIAQELGMHGLLRHIGVRLEPRGGSGGRRPEPVVAARGVLRREGEFWTAGLDGSVVRLRDSKGLRCLAQLLASPHDGFEALELERLAAKAGSAGGESDALVGAEGALRPDGGDPVLDARATAEYRRRLAELRSELAEAEGFHDAGRSEALRAEIDTLTAELASALGLGGRPRILGSLHERARVNVTKQIRGAIQRIGASDPALGEALERTVRTGRLCVYVPDPRSPIDWNF